MMNIVIIGASGKMGQEIIKQVNLVPDKYTIKGRIANHNINNYQTSFENINNVDICIDFSTPVQTIKTIEHCVINNIALVIGTTGFNQKELDHIKEAAKKIPILLSPNMSLSVNLLMKLVKTVAQTIPEFETEIFEAHHKHKKDAPSGTAIKLGQCIASAKNINFDDHAIYSRYGRELSKKQNEIGFSVLRAGNIIGLHEVSFISDNEQLTLKSEITDRSSFARGALIAADFIYNKPYGLYTMEDVFNI